MRGSTLAADGGSPAHDESLRRRRRQGLLDLRLEHRIDVLRRDGADELVGDAAVAPDQEGLRDPVYAPVDGGAAVLVGADHGKGIAVTAEEAAGIVGLVLVVDADDANALVAREIRQQRRLV